MRVKYVPPAENPDRDLNHGEQAPARPAVDLVAWAQPEKKRRKRSFAPRRKRSVEEARQRIADENFEGASARVLLALYRLFYVRVYGQEPIALDPPKESQKAVYVISGLSKRYFEGSSQAVADFMFWAWMKEEEYEQWRRKHGREGSQLTWMRLFSAPKVAEYRLTLERKKVSSG